MTKNTSTKSRFSKNPDSLIWDRFPTYSSFDTQLFKSISYRNKQLNDKIERTSIHYKYINN